MNTATKDAAAGAKLLAAPTRYCYEPDPELFQAELEAKTLLPPVPAQLSCR